MNVEDLKIYGKSLMEIVDSFPRTMMMKVGAIFAGEILKKTQYFGIFSFMLRVRKEKVRLIDAYPEAYADLKKMGPTPTSQFLSMIAVFNVLAARDGREETYIFLKGIWHRYAKYSMPMLYDVDNLCQCDGACYDNFKKFNVAMFNAMDDYHVKEITDEEDCLTIIVDRCGSVDIAKAFDCPEIGMLGCDHDVAGYPAIEEKVGADFRRRHTIAKGDAYCDFMFFRRGTAPFDASENR